MYGHDFGKSSDSNQFYRYHYDAVMGVGLVGLLWRLIHKLMDFPFRNATDLRIVEVGAGSGQHRDLTKLKFFRYLETDIRVPERIFDRALRDFKQADAHTLENYSNGEFNLLIATCLLVHLDNPKIALSTWKRVVQEGGSIVLYVPCEPGLVLRFTRFFTTRRRVEKQGFNHKVLHWQEHRNHFIGMDVLIREIFCDSQIRVLRFPFQFLPWNFNLFYIYYIKLD